jgi:hypothetical protein
MIFVGIVTDIQEEWDAEKQIPHTLVTFSTLTVMKGDVGPKVTLRFIGGHTPDGGEIIVPDTPRFTVGEKNVVFSAGNYRDAIPLVGIQQGLLRVITESASGREVVQDHAGAPIIGIQLGEFLKQEAQRGDALTVPSTQPEPLPLSAVLNAIQQELGKHHGK